MENKEILGEQKDNNCKCESGCSCKNSKKKIIILSILGALLLIGIILYIYFFWLKEDEDNNNDKNDNIVSEEVVDKEENKEEVKDDKENEEVNQEEDNTLYDKSKFVILQSDYYDKESIYYATDSFFETGDKKLLVSSEHIYAVQVYDNKVYYLDESNKLVVYDIDLDVSQSYNFSNVDVNYLTSILPGTKYTIISDGLNYAVIDLKNNTYHNLEIEDDNSSIAGVFDDANNILYHSTSDTVYALNIITNEEVEIKGANGTPSYQDDNNIYIEGIFDDAEVFYSLTKGSTTAKQMDIFDYNANVSSISNIGHIGDEVYIIFNDYEKLIRYVGDKMSYLLEKDYIWFYIIGDKLYIASADMDYSSDIAVPGAFNSFYVYDPNDGTINAIENDYLKDLFRNYDVVYNLK